jgi:glycosyltransferase involved in cell wall biosynthesis
VPVSRLPVIPDGIDVADLLHLTPSVRELYNAEKLYNVEIVVLTPTRMVRRKGLERGLEIIAAIKRQGKSVRWFITGAPDPHNADSMEYYGQLVSLRRKRRLENEVTFLFERFDGKVTSADLSGLYGLSNVLLFPSEREGFGIPVLEAGIAELLLVVSDIPSFRELASQDTVLIYHDENPETVAQRMLWAFDRSPRLAFRKKIISNYSWEAIFVKKILPAVNNPNQIWRYKRRHKG